MQIITQELKFSEYSHALYVKNNNAEINENDIICLMITHKVILTKNNTQLNDVTTKKSNEKTVIPYKDFKVFTQSGQCITFTIYENKELEKVINQFKKFTKNKNPILYDNFVEQSPLLFNSDNYCYINKQNIQKITIRNGNKNLGNENYMCSDLPLLILNQEIEGVINFKILEIDLGVKKIKLNMYMKKTLEYNELNTPGLLNIKQKIKRML